MATAAESPEAADAPKRRKLRWKRRLVVWGLCALAVALVVSAMLVSARLDSWATDATREALRSAVGPTSDVQRVEVTLWPLSVDLYGISAVGAEELAGIEFDVEQAKIRVRWRSLPQIWVGALEFEEVSITHPVVRLQLNELPQTEGESRPLRIQLERLEITRGELFVDETKIPLDVHAKRLEVDGLWSPERRALSGFTSFETTARVGDVSQEIDLDWAGRFDWSGKQIRIEQLKVMGEGLEVASHLDVNFEDGGSIMGGGQYEIELAQWTPFLGPEADGLEGVLQGSLDVVAETGGPWSVEGPLDATNMRWRGLEAKRVRGSLRLDPNWLVVQAPNVETMDGLASGTVRLSMGEDAQIYLDLTAAAVDSARLFQQIRVPLPLLGRVDGQMSLAGPVSRSAEWQGDGTFSVRPGEYAGEVLSLLGSGSLLLEKGRLVLNAPAMRVASTQLAVDVDAGLFEEPPIHYISLKGRTESARQTQLATLQILDNLDLSMDPVWQRELQGTGALTADFTLAEVDRFQIMADLEQGGFDGTSFDRAAVQVEMNGGELELRDMLLVRGEERVSGDARFVEGTGWENIDLEGRALDVATWAELLGLEGDPQGVLDATVAMRTESSGLAGEGQLTWNEAALYGVDLGTWSSPIRFDGNSAQFTDIEGSGDLGTGRGTLDLELSQPSEYRIQLEELSVKLAELERMFETDLGLGGELTLSGELFGSASGPEGDVTLQLVGGQIADQSLGTATGQAQLSGQSLLVELNAMDESGWRLQGGVENLMSAAQLDLALELDQAFVRLPESLPKGIELQASGGATASGPLLDPSTWKIEGELDSAWLWLVTREWRNKGPIRFRFSEGLLDVQPFEMATSVADLSIQTAIDFNAETIDIGLKGAHDLGLISILRPDLRANGDVALDVRIKGAFASPDWQGSISLDDGRLRWLEIPQRIEQLEARVDFNGDRGVVKALRGVVGGGYLEAAGELKLVGGIPSVFNLRGEIDGVQLGAPEGFDGLYRGQIAFSGDATRAKISGDLKLDRGLYREEFDLAGMVGIGVRGYQGAVAAAEDNYELELDLKIRADDNVWLRNELAELEASVNLDIAGTVDRPEVTGRVGILAGGEITFRNVEYRIENGGLDFVDPDRIDPYLSLLARTNVDSYDIRLRIDGRLDDFEYELTSTPTLSQQDIIALLTTGNTLRDLTANQQGGGAGFTGDLAANYFAGALTGRFEDQLESLLGLERIQINPLLLDGQADPTTRITLGKEVANDLFVLVSSDLGSTERQLYELEWRASRKLRFSAQRNTEGGIGGDIDFIDRFWLRKPKPNKTETTSESPETDAVGPKAQSAILRSIEWSGIRDEDRENFKKLLGLEVDEPFDRSRLVLGMDNIRRRLVRQGRIESTVRARLIENDDDSLKLRIEVNYGEEIKVQFEGAKRKDEKALRKLLETTWIDGLFEEDLYRDSVERIREYYQAKGFYAADVEARRSGPDEPPQVTFTIDTGKPVQIKSLEIETVNAEGENVSDSPIDTDRIRGQILSRPSSLFSRRLVKPQVLRDDVRAIRNLLRDDGYLDSRVEPVQVQLSTDGTSAVLRFVIEPGQLYRIGSVSFQAALPYSDEQFLEWSELGDDDHFSPRELLQAESRIRAELDKRGHPDARVRGSVERQEDQKVALTLKVEADSARTVGELVVLGNRLTRRDVIAREATFENGDNLSRESMLSTQHQLYRLGIFNNVRVRHEPMPDGKEGQERVTIEVEEAPPLGLTLSAGYNSESGARGGVSLTHENVGGRDRVLSLQTFASGIERRIQLVGKEPRLFGLRSPLFFQWGREEREETGYDLERRSFAVRVDREFSPSWSGFLRYNLQQVDLLDISDALAVREEKLENLQLGDLGFVLVNDKRDDPFLTKNGTYLSLDTAWFSEVFGSDATFSKSLVQYSFFDTYRTGLTWAGSVRVGISEPFAGTGRVPLSERFFAGGDSTLRGFERDEVGPSEGGLPSGGEGLFLFNQELRFPLIRQLRGVVFYDAGNIYVDRSEFDPLDLRHVLGAGLRLETPIGPLRFEYGSKIDRRSGESQGEFFLAIGAAF